MSATKIILTPKARKPKCPIFILHRVKSMQTNSNADQLIQAVVNDTSNGLLMTYLEKILRDPQRLREIARSSYRHQLGFLKIALRNDPSGHSLRLHIWDSNTIALEDIHSHCADFMSRVVSGGIEESRYELEPGANFSLFRYRFDERACRHIAQKNGMTNVFQTSKVTFLEGAIYQRKSHELHTVRNIDSKTITLSAWGIRSKDAIVLKSASARAEDCVAAIGVSPNLVRTVLTDIVGG
ncbi:hypothetical protein SR858_27310 [Duganella zoogloeoides]|uniref:Uncharacterized protein n=1 Tax=Duganella zoogloeoides TaxID=75659 RepID=A0ABZ0XYP2_9BURK|nr:hypothetical protein [Duganella zoogloeoides]WQH04703.1 hypothetical protein SR858_27310 [Duganella zoogloeoides]